MLEPGRKYNSVSAYRYGFNGQEKSLEIDTFANLTTAKFWEYDSRIGRRWNVDPSPTDGISAYSAFANNPNFFTDILGDTSKFFGNEGSLIYQNNKGRGNNLYLVSSEQFKLLRSKYKNENTLTNELVKNGIKAYDNQDDAAAAWAPNGFAATRGDPNNLERAAQIFHARATGDQKTFDLYVVGSTVVGHKSTEPGVSQETHPSGSTITLNGKDITTYQRTGTERTWRNNIIVSQRQITFHAWKVSAMIHTHNPGHDKYSISPGGLLGEKPGGDYGIAVDGISVYLVPTTSSYASKMFRLDLSAEDADNYFPSVSDAQRYMSEQQKVIPLK